MNRTTLNGLQPREARELDRNSYDWFDGPMWPEDREPGIAPWQFVLLILSIVGAVAALAYKFGGPV